MRILELGNYIVPAYAGMILAEQGHQVVKWIYGRDPLLNLHRGAELWQWINEGKLLEERHARNVTAGLEKYDAVMDNFLPDTWTRWNIDRAALAQRESVRWISVQGETGQRSFDIIAQAQAWGNSCPWVPFYIGDTIAGLWMALKMLASEVPGLFVLGHASCLAKMVEGELMVLADRQRERTAWDAIGTYEMTEQEARVEYKGEAIQERRRDDAWRLRHLWHDNGRIRI